ncbi:MAG: DUF262 domain-containing protein, partial [Acidobacteriota bacterium]|nr:DUF262 domain-containing protein [Acidobacteriota bacterium]
PDSLVAKSTLKVYLDHHIKRENLLYKRVTTPVGATRDQPTHLKIVELYGQKPKTRLLKKPDFQRATWAWTPEDCVSLLKSVLTEQVVPSVIMWLGPDKSQYVVDGGHRISVLIAWVKDDWGDKLPSEIYDKDKMLEDSAKAAAQRVRALLKESAIGFFADYEAAEARYEELENELGRKPGFGEMDADSLRYAEMMREWEGVNIGFPILWVRGDYAKAEESFLNINKTGRHLTDWETKLVENRNSSFARTVMSISQLYDAEHCWPIHDDEVKSDPDLQQKAATLLERVRDLHKLLFTPDYATPIKRAEQPLLATPYTKPEK